MKAGDYVICNCVGCISAGEHQVLMVDRHCVDIWVRARDLRTGVFMNKFVDHLCVVSEEEAVIHLSGLKK